MKKGKMDIRPYTRQFYRGNVGNLLLTLTETVLSAGASLLVSWLLLVIMDLIAGVDTGFDLQSLVLLSLLVVAMIFLGCGISYYAKPRFITRGIAQYKEYIFGELTKKNIAAFSGENSSTYISALTNDIQTIEQGYLWNVFSLLECLLIFSGALIMMFCYSPLLTWIAIGFALLPVVASVLTGNQMAMAEKKVSERNEVYTATIKESLGGFSVIKSFKAEAQMLRIFCQHVSELTNARCAKEKMKILVQMFGAVAGVTAQLGVFLFGAYFALSGKGVTAGTTLIFVQLMNYILNPIGVIPTCIAERKAAKALVEKVATALSANIRQENQGQHIKLQKGITVQDLSFGYEPEKQVLQHIDYHFALGKKYAIVGASGSGKSTLLNLLMAAHPNYAGTICYDETEMSQISSENLYEMVSVVQQNVFVFNASIRDNITMFADFPGEEVDRAIELSGLAKLIAERGEAYLCGENGNNLSGGEKQRISIARSLLKKSQVLLVDEATAALDAQTAFQVTDAILEMDELTRIVVTHALDENLLKRYDHILTLKNGAIAECGTFEELMEKKGYFYSLFTVSQ